MAIVMRLRSLINDIRDILTQFCIMEWGVFKNDQGYPFKTFLPFQVKYQVHFFKQRGKTNVNSDMKATPEEVDLLNKAIMKYFVDHIGEIKVAMREYVGTSSSWEDVLTPEIVAWVVDRENPIRKWGNYLVHETTDAEVKDATHVYMSTLVLDDSHIKPILHSLLLVHSSASTMLGKKNLPFYEALV